MICEIVRDQAFLAQPSVPATADDVDVAKNLRDTLAFNRANCVGMAANMIGVQKRIIIVETEEGDVVMFNPVILKKSEPYETKEGCMSLVGIRSAKRWKHIKVQWQNEKMQTRVKNFEGWTAEIIQHEIDHCNGIVI